MKPEQYEYIGQYLRESRESLKVTVAMAAAALHIRPKYIHAIEGGRLEELPGKAYIRGYIKNYADYLGINSEEALRAYENLPANAARDFFIPEPMPGQHVPSRRMVWLSVACLIMLYMYWYKVVYHPPAAERMVEEVPWRLMQSLDKNAYAAMDKAWERCLDSGDAACFIAIITHQTPAPDQVIYDIVFPLPTAEKP